MTAFDEFGSSIVSRFCNVAQGSAVSGSGGAGRSVNLVVFDVLFRGESVTDLAL